MSKRFAAIAVLALAGQGCRHDSQSVEPRREETMQALTTTLSGPPSFRAGEPMLLTLTVEGPGRFCTYHTPFEGVRNAFLEIHRADGSEVSYGGMMAKRAPPRPEDFITLARGERRAAQFDLKEGYELTPGTYRVRFAGGSISGLPASPEIQIRVEAPGQ